MRSFSSGIGVVSGKLLLFGGTGAIGSALRPAFTQHNWQITATGRRGTPDGTVLVFDPNDASFDSAMLDRIGPFDAVCWAQGANLNDSVYDVEPDKHLEIYRANVLFNIVTLRLLLTRQLLRPGSRLCVVSSIWQKLARQNKLSYMVSKAALQGFVLSAAVDLAKDGHLINAVLPGALDTPMTRQNLTADQIATLSKATLFNRLPTLDSVVNLVLFLCSSENTSLTGQFIAVDLGFSRVRIL